MSPALLLIRHGEAVGNREHRLIGQSGVPLSELGRLQARAVAERLSGLPITRILTSDVARAAETAGYIAEACGHETTAEPGLREIANGEWSMLLPDEIAVRWPELWARYRAGEDVARPGGERWTDVGRRAVRTVEALMGGLAGDDVIVAVTHGGPIIQLMRWAAGIDYERSIYVGPFGGIGNASISVLHLRGPSILAFNDVGHLQDLTRDRSHPYGW